MKESTMFKLFRPTPSIVLITISIIPVIMLLIPVAIPAAAATGVEFPYVYQRAGFGIAGELTVEIESAYGTREARPFGEEGLEQRAGIRFGLTEKLSLEAWAGTLFNNGVFTEYAHSFEADFKLVERKRSSFDLFLRTGYLRDYERVPVPYAGFAASSELGKIDLTVSAIGEIPLAGNRDAVDLIMGTAVSRGFGDNVRLGLEVIGEDIEGFWDEKEAEGGAKIVAGPTLWLGLPGDTTFRINTGAIIPATTNPPTRIAQDPDISGNPGFILRAVVSRGF